MDKRIIYAGVVLVVCLVGLMALSGVKEEPPECTIASDCEGLPHAECEGFWTCVSGECIWECEKEPAECSEDSDCVVSGCSSQVCSTEEVTTTCEWREEYGCLRLSNCGCIEGKCAWEETAGYLSCLEGGGNGSTVPPSKKPR